MIFIVSLCQIIKLFLVELTLFKIRINYMPNVFYLHLLILNYLIEVLINYSLYYTPTIGKTFKDVGCYLIEAWQKDIVGTTLYKCIFSPS